MTETDSKYLGVIEQVPSVEDKIGARELTMKYAQQEGGTHINIDRQFLLYLKINTPEAAHNFELQGQTIEATMVNKIQDTLIIAVSMNGKTYTLQCDSMKFHRNIKYAITSEIEQDAESLIFANDTRNNIKDLFVTLHGHGRLWAVSDSQTETWEVLLLDEINYIKIPHDMETNTYILAQAFSKLARLHEKDFIYGRPTLEHLAFKAENSNPVSHVDKLVWIRGLALQNTFSSQPVTKNILKMKDITSLLLDNKMVLSQLGVERLGELDLNIFKLYHYNIGNHRIPTSGPYTVFPTIIMPHAILNADIIDANCEFIINPVLYDPAFWTYNRRVMIQFLLEDLSNETKLQSIIQSLVSYYKTARNTPQVKTTPLTPSVPLIPVPPTLPPQVPRDIPVKIIPSQPAPVLPVFPAQPKPPTIFSASIGTIYLLMFNQKPISPFNSPVDAFGQPIRFYKYKLLPNNEIVIGVGDINPLSFHGDINTYRLTYTTNTIVTVSPNVSFPLTFNFLSGISYVMQVMWGVTVKKFDLRFVPPIEIQ